MRITVESTDKFVQIDGVPARVWEGETANGIPMFCMITRIGVEDTLDLEEFVRDLHEQKPPVIAKDFPSNITLQEEACPRT